MPEEITTTVKQPDNALTVLKLEFEDIQRPTYKEDKKKGYVKYGEKNDYPEYLLGMFNASGKHGAIIQGKADFTIGNGFAYLTDDQAADTTKKTTLVEKANNDGETLTEVAAKVATDVELFAAGYLQVLYNKKKRVSEIYHVDFTKIRVSKDLKTFYYSDNWLNENGTENSKADITPIPAFDLSNPKGKQILFIREYKPGMDVYPKPNYYAALRYIQVDICIGEYHLNGITNGMFASKLINFNNGVPEKPEQKEIEKKVNEKFAGSKNAGKVMLSFNKNGENATTVLDLSGTELDKHFDLLNKTTETQIFSSHRVTSPALFGIKSDGIFTNNSELRQAFELFQNTYINGKRNLLEKYFNLVLSVNNLPKVYLQRSEPIGITFSENTAAKVLTRDEIREILGKQPLTEEQKAEIDQAGNNEQQLTEAFRKIIKDSRYTFSDDLNDERDIEIFSKYGQKKNLFEIVESRRGNYETDFAFSNHYFALSKELTDQQKKVIGLLNQEPKTTPAAIAKALGISEGNVNGILKALEADGLLNVTSTGIDEEKVIERTPTPEATEAIDGEKTSINVMYSYEGILDDRNRPFCRKMLELDNMYSREDIEAISAELGYSVWHRRGGWYKTPGGEARPYCRHYWQTNTVITKTKV